MRRSQIKNILLTAGACLLLVIIVIFTSTRSQWHPGKSIPAGDTLNLQLTPLELPGGWGYQITVNGKLYIYQDQIPAMPGHTLFSSREKAMRVGNLVLQKLKHGQLPSVRKADLERLDAL